MTTIAIELPDEKVERLRNLAKESQVSVEELLAAKALSLAEEPTEEFRRAFRYVLKKNIDLLRRLA